MGSMAKPNVLCLHHITSFPLKSYPNKSLPVIRSSSFSCEENTNDRRKFLSMVLMGSAALGLQLTSTALAENWGTRSFLREHFYEPGLSPEDAVARISQTTGLHIIRECLRLLHRVREKPFLNMEEENPKQKELPSLTSNSVEKELTMTPTPYFHFQTQKPVWKLSPWNGGSTLYDSYELKAVTQQLNRTIQGSQTMYSPCLNHTKFVYPFRGCLDRVYKENTKAPKQLTGSKLNDTKMEDKPNSLALRKFMSRLWKKIKQILLSKNVAAACVCNQNRS